MFSGLLVKMLLTRSRKDAKTARFIQIAVLSLFSLQLQAADNPAPSGNFENTACIQCHEQNHVPLVNDWRNSVHASAKSIVNCVDCHGKSHQQTASLARMDTTCINCHGDKSPAVHSYLTSKHGVLMKLEASHYDWSKKLQQANYRAPGCSYCHMHKGNHGLMQKAQLLTPCQDCHAPRYQVRLLKNSEDMLKIAAMKYREAEALVQQSRIEFGPDKIKPAVKQLEQMKKHLKNINLGTGHQSPDYQWWHGQPALDGDLLRIKGTIGELKREKEIARIASQK